MRHKPFVAFSEVTEPTEFLQQDSDKVVEIAVCMPDKHRDTIWAISNLHTSDSLAYCRAFDYERPRTEL